MNAVEMDDVDLNSPNVEISDTHIHPWDLIRHGLSQELDTDQGLFQEVCQRAAQDLGPVFIQSVNNAHQFFEALHNNLSNDEVLVLDYLIALVELINLHSHQGSQPFKNVLLEYKVKLTKYREDCARISRSKAEEFIGRTKDLQDVEEKLTGKKYLGVAICGLGGMGKTSLATQVCYQLQNATKIWHIKSIDMREKEDLIDLLRDMVGEIGLDCNSTELNDLYSELCNGLKGIKTRTIFFMDNLDDMMKTAEKKDRLLYFLEHFCKDIKSMGTEVRILVTLRQKLVPEDKLRTTASQKISRGAERLSGLMFEVELSKLKLLDGVNLFKACCRRPFTPAPDNEVCQNIVNLCGGSPLAIKSVGAAVRSGKVIAEMLAKKLEDLPNLDVESNCLAQTFDTLDKSKQHLLVKLHVFGTAKFDLAFAAFVLGEKSMDEEKPIVFDTSLNMIYLKSRHFVEVDDLQKEETDDIRTTSKSAKFSLHPLVHKFLLKIANQEEFEEPVNEAKSLFVAYVEKKTNKIFEYFEKNCVKAWKELKDFKVHLKTYYELIQKSSPEFWNKGSRTVLTCKRVSEVADLFLEDYYKFRLLQKCIELSKGDERKFLETALWQIHLGKKFFESDRNEIAGEVLNCVLNETLQNISPDLSSDELGQLVEVAGAAFYLAGKLCIQDRKYVEAMHYLEDTKQLWSNKVEKAVKKKYKIDLALVYNSLGKVYANMTPQNLQKSKYNHLKAFLFAYRISDNFNNIDIPLYIQNIGRCSYREGLELEKLNKKEQANQSFRDAETYFRHAMKLFEHFKMEKFDSYAEVLRSLAYVEMKLRQMGLAEDNISKCYELRKKIMSPPHEAITLTVHDVATVRIERAIYLYWDYFENKRGDEYASINKLYEAIADYEHLMHLTKLGGLPRNHPEYPSMKRSHLWALTQVKETKKIEKAIQFYKDFESGKFEEKRKQKRSKKETTRFFYTYDQLQTMLAAGAFEGATVSACSSSESSSDSDDNVPESPKPPLVTDTPVTEDLVLRKTRLNFNYVFRQCPEKEKARYGDTSSDDYFIEENFEGVNILDNFNACENLFDQVQKMECDSDDDEIDELASGGSMRQLERRTSDISVSSQSSLEEDDLEDRRKRFARKGSRERSLQNFLEDRLLESKIITKGRHSSSSSISIEVSMDEDSTFVEVERNPALVSLKKFIYDRFAARDQQDSKKSQQEIKQKRSRMQQQHATITEEPAGLTDTAESKATVKRKK